MQKLALIEIVMDDLSEILNEGGLPDHTMQLLIRARANAARVDIAQREIVNTIRHTQVLGHTRKVERQYAEDMPMYDAATSSAAD